MSVKSLKAYLVLALMCASAEAWAIDGYTGGYHATGISNDTVYLNDLEDHTWTYYSGVDTNVDGGYYNTNYKGLIYSPNPRNVTIVYNANGGKVSIEENTDSVYVYYKTLEEDSTSGEYSYQVISNPFSKRPTGKGFLGWKIISGGSYIKNHSDGDTLSLDEKIVFNNLATGYTTNCMSATIRFQALWTTATTQVLTATGSTTISFTGGNYETNFVIMKASNSGTLTVSSPCTIMMVEPDGSADYRSSYTFSGTLSPNNTGVTKMEWTKWISSKDISANAKNMTLGRGLPSTSQCARNITGINSSGNNTILRNTIKVESGKYVNLHCIQNNGSAQVSDPAMNVTVIIGNDYDRAKKNGNSSLIITESINNYYVRFTTTANRYNKHSIDMTIKSGLLNTNYHIEKIKSAEDAITFTSAYAIYLGCYNSDPSFGRRNLLIEGGETGTIAGGSTNLLTSWEKFFTIFNLRIKGGTVHGSIYGGCAHASIVGDINYVVTGGTIVGWIAAGCNGTEKDGGKVYGKSYIYVGGKARVDSNGSNQVLGAAAIGGNLYGAGSGRSDSQTSGEMTYGTNVVIADNAFIERNTFAGGNYGYSKADSKIYVVGGTVGGGVYGGSNHQEGVGIDIYMTGGTVKGGVYGGSNTSGTMSGNTNLKIMGGTVGTSTTPANIHGGGYGENTAVTGNVYVSIGAEPSGTDKTANKDSISKLTIYGDVYGGSALGKTNTGSNKTTEVKMYSGTVNGDVYGGALGSTSAYATIGATSQTVDIYGGKVTGGVYGGSNINANLTATTPPQLGVTIHDTYTPTAAGEYAIGNVFGGGNGATAAASGQPGAHDTNANGTFVTVEKGSVGNVFGGGNAATAMKTSVSVTGGTVGNIYGGSNQANINGTTSISVSDSATVSTGIYGGCNTQGKVTGVTNVSITGGTVGSSTALAKIHGGGYGHSTTTGNDAKVTIGTLTSGHGSTTGPTIYADIYGGSALGNVCDSTASPVDTAIVNIYSGNILKGNVYGGGLGTKSGMNGATADTLALVNGNTQVNVYAAHFGADSQIFGGNNLNGSPTGSTTVHVYETAAPSTVDSIAYNQTSFPGETATNPWSQYAIKAVYGGSNKAQFHDAAAIGQTNVIVDDCASSIGYVYGGSNAADVYGSTAVTINGGSKIGVVFGGGNGKTEAGEPINPGANVKKGTSGKGGQAVTNIYGGTVDFVFGGSNTLGEVEDSAFVNLKDSSACNYQLGEVYGAGNQAAMHGTICLNIDCVPGLSAIYGGARNANLYSDINLTITGGSYKKVFGGNNLGGTLDGSITVNIDENGCQPVRIDSLYACGNQAAYTTPSGKADPVVNIKAATYIGNVYGGGLGSTATVTGNPTVNINMVKGKVGGVDQAIGTIGNVFGGGDAAATFGNTTINLATEAGKAAPVTGNVYGGGNQAAVTGNTIIHAAGGTAANIFGGGNGYIDAGNPANNKAADINGTTQVFVSGGTVSTGIYGGCNALGTINKVSGANGNTVVTINGGNIGTNLAKANIHGGGYGALTNVEGSVNVTVNDTTATQSLALYGDIYGGSALGQVNGTAVNTTDTTRVTLTQGTVHGDIYGGGLGDASTAAKVWGPVKVTVTNGQATNVFGCNNLNGAPQDSVFVNINGGTISNNVYGGGNEASYSGTPIVNINDCAVSIGSVYGGGNAAATNGTNATIWGGTISNAFGGGNGTVHAADVNGNSSLTIHGGTITNVFAGSNTSGTISGTMALNIDQQTKPGCSQCTQHIDSIYGGGNKAEGKGAIITIGCGAGYLGNVFGGAKAAKINGKLVLNINGGQIDNVFGGNDQSGEITDSIIVNINNGDCASAYIGNVYGGGNQAPFDHNTQVNLISGKVGYMKNGALVGGNVFGGGYGARAIVSGNTEVNLKSDPVNHPDSLFKVLGSIYGGGEMASVQGNTTLNLTKGTAAGVFGGGYGEQTNVDGNVDVALNGATVTGDVYGGSAFGNVNSDANDYTHVTLTRGSVTGNIYGGGLGQQADTTVTPAVPAIAAKVYGPVTVALNGGTLTGNAFGGNNKNGAPQSTVNVELNSTQTAAVVTGNMYGGGNQAAYTGNPTVQVTAGKIDGSVFGGGLGNQAIVTGDTQVSVSGGSIVTGDVFGGGNAANVKGGTNVKITGTTTKVDGSVFGGGNEANVSGPTYVQVGGRPLP